MKKILIRIGILFVIFIVALVGFASFMNEEKTDSIEEMKKATLPMIYIEHEGILINPMYGYTQEMQVNYLRDTLTPINTNRQLSFAVQPFGEKIQQVQYVIRTSDNKNVVENGKITSLKEEDGYVKGTFKIENPILMNQEYTLVFQLHTESGKVNYYTRILQRAGLNVTKYLEYVDNFYKKSLDKNAGGELSAALEPDDSTANNNFTEVTIHSNQSQITWGNLSPKLYRQAIPSIKEMNETTASIALNYMIAAENGKKEQEVYQVEEFYRMRYAQSKVMLLDFNRSAKQIFDGRNSVMTSSGINLGITDKEVPYVCNKNGDIVAFVQQGDLWSYNKSSSKLSSVFSFRDHQKMDERNDNDSHDIKIVRVEENGEIDFVLYGYMNRGNHEGETGIGVYHYYADKNAVEERIFIPVSKSFEFLARDLERLSYVNKQNKLFLYLEEKLYQVDLMEKSYKLLKDSIDPDCFVIAKNQSHVAWMDDMEENNSKSVTIMDFESGETTQVVANEQERIKALGFINDDFVYGLAKENTIIKDPSGNITFGMYAVRIQDFAGSLLKEYAQPDIWISKVAIKEGLIELSRVIWQNNQYVPIANDHIMNNLQNLEKGVEVKSSLTNTKGRQISLVFPSPIKDKEPLVTYSRNVVKSGSNTLEMKVTEKNIKNVYYVYSKGKLESIWTKANDAVKAADEGVGVVLNGAQQYIWERGNKVERIHIDTDEIPEVVLSGVIDDTTLQTSLGESYKVLNFTGCTLEEVLYQVGQARPVVAKISDTETRIIVGYDTYNTWLYNPATQEVKPYGLNDSTTLFEEAGNVFVSYIEALPANEMQKVVEGN